MTATFNGSADSTYDLNPNYPQFTFGQQTNIDVTTGGWDGAGVYGSSSVDWSITNAGSIAGQDAVAFIGNATFNNAATGKVSNASPYGYGILIVGVGTITNAGSIMRPNEPQYPAIVVRGVGSVDNVAGGTIYGGVFLGTSGTGSGTVTNAGSISAYGSGSEFAGAIWLENGGGQVNNSGSVTFGGPNESGIFFSGGGTVTNSGTIQDTSGSGTVVSGMSFAWSSGTATNSGTVSLSVNEDAAGIWIGEVGTVIDGVGTASNSGTISVTVYDRAWGIELGGLGYASNTGTISVYANNHAWGIELASGGNVSNTGTISISAYDHGAGVYAAGAAAYISNSGSISAVANAYAFGVDLIAGGTFTNSGSVYASAASSSAVQFDAGGTLDNQAGGSIVNVGGAGVYVDGSAGVSITNAGTISGTYFAIDFNDAGTYGNTIVNTDTLDSHAQLIGGVQGSTGFYVTNNLVLNGKSDLGSAVYDFQGLTINKGANWVLSGDDSFSSTITDRGSLTVSASGTLSGDLTIGKGGVATFDSSYDGDVTFTGEGELELRDNYTGTISRLVAGDSIDFLSHKYTDTDTVRVFGDHLLIDNKAGAEIASITLSSHDPASQFTLGADSAGHILLTYK